MTPMSVPAVPPAHSRSAGSAPARGTAAQGRRNEQKRAEAEAEQHGDTSAAADLESPTEVAPAEKPAAPRGPSLLKRLLLWAFASRPTKRADIANRTRTAHARWRGYALGCYGLIVAATLAGQLYSSNPLGVYVKLQRVDLPRSTLVFVRNDSSRPWKHVRIRLNGIYTYHRDEIGAGDNVPLDVDKMFAITDGMGKVLRRPTKDMPIESLTLDCDSGHYETELR
jgi:hypothetical protein